MFLVRRQLVRPRGLVRSSSSFLDIFAGIDLEEAPKKKEEPDNLDSILASINDDVEMFQRTTHTPPGVSKEVIDEEKRLFGGVFKTYLNEDQKAESNKALWNLRESIKAPESQISDAINNALAINQAGVFGRASSKLKNEVFARAESALKPTLVHIKGLPVEDKVKFIEHIFEEWNTTLSKKKDLFLNRLFRSVSDGFTPEHERFIDAIFKTSSKTPEQPVLNAFTMPIIFNTVIHDLAFNHASGQLALTLFHQLKKDLKLYALMINQRSYNEILRISWIYNGKYNLYNVEIYFLEMLNNGFQGDELTFHILKQILVDYYRLKAGKFTHNGKLVSAVWTKEDDRRAHNLQRRLHTLGRSLK